MTKAKLNKSSKNKITQNHFENGISAMLFKEEIAKLNLINQHQCEMITILKHDREEMKATIKDILSRLHVYDKNIAEFYKKYELPLKKNKHKNEKTYSNANGSSNHHRLHEN